MDPLAKLHDRLKARLPDTIADLRAKAAEHAPDAPRREAGYTIRNAAGDEAVVRIYDEIWMFGINAVDLVADLDEITAPRMRVEINSPGGDVFDGIAIYNALRNHPAHVTTRVDGIAASIASVIAQAGDRRVMQSASQMMIHNAWGLTVGDSRDHGDMSELLAQQDGIIAGIYANRSGGSVDRFQELMNAETWLTDETAVAEGLADEVIEPPAKADPDNKGRRTLNQQITDAMAVVSDTITSAQRVDALRADAGKGLSNRNTESLAGLRTELERLDGLLTPTDTDTAWTDVELAAKRARLDTLMAVKA